MGRGHDDQRGDEEQAHQRGDDDGPTSDPRGRCRGVRPPRGTSSPRRRSCGRWVLPGRCSARRRSRCGPQAGPPGGGGGRGDPGGGAGRPQPPPGGTGGPGWDGSGSVHGFPGERGPPGRQRWWWRGEPMGRWRRRWGGRQVGYRCRSGCPESPAVLPTPAFPVHVEIVANAAGGRRSGPQPRTDLTSSTASRNCSGPMVGGAPATCGQIRLARSVPRRARASGVYPYREERNIPTTVRSPGPTALTSQWASSGRQDARSVRGDRHPARAGDDRRRGGPLRRVVPRPPGQYRGRRRPLADHQRATPRSPRRWLRWWRGPAPRPPRRRGTGSCR